MHFKTKNRTRDKERHFIITNRKIHQKDMPSKMCMHLITASQKVGSYLFFCCYFYLLFSWNRSIKFPGHKITSYFCTVKSWLTLNVSLLDLSCPHPSSIFLFWPQRPHSHSIFLKSIIFPVRKDALDKRFHVERKDVLTYSLVIP